MNQAQEAGMSVDSAIDLYCADTDMIRGEGISSRGNVRVSVYILQDFDRL